MAAWFRVDLARATTTVAWDGVTPSVLHIEHGEGDEVTRHHKSPICCLTTNRVAVGSIIESSLKGCGAAPTEIALPGARNMEASGG
jgi:hypothetical protein